MSMEQMPTLTSQSENKKTLTFQGKKFSTKWINQHTIMTFSYEIVKKQIKIALPCNIDHCDSHLSWHQLNNMAQLRQPYIKHRDKKTATIFGV